MTFRSLYVINIKMLLIPAASTVHTHKHTHRKRGRERERSEIKLCAGQAIKNRRFPAEVSTHAHTLANLHTKPSANELNLFHRCKDYPSPTSAPG